MKLYYKDHHVETIDDSMMGFFFVHSFVFPNQKHEGTIHSIKFKYSPRRFGANIVPVGMDKTYISKYVVDEFGLRAIHKHIKYSTLRELSRLTKNRDLWGIPKVTPLTKLQSPYTK